MESMLYVNGEFLSDSEDVIDTGPENVELVPCSICTRTFTPAALDKHIGICEKMHIQKRTPFDSFRQRKVGTDLETYLPSNYGLITKSKTSKLSPTDTKSASRSISSVYDASTKLASRRVTPTKEVPKMMSKETPLMNRSMMSKRSLGPINEVCPHCSRSFGTRAYDRHVEWCRERIRIAAPTLSAQQHLAKERMQARTKYKAPTLRSKREKNREKYSSLSESMNNLSDSGGVSIMDFNSVADPYERGRKSSIMSLSMTSSIASDGGFSDKYDPFISAKRQFEDLFNASNIATSTPAKGARSPTGANMSKSLCAAKSPSNHSPSSPIKNQSLSKSSFRRTSSLRVPKKTSPISFMPKYKPSIQRGISDEGPISSNFMKPEEYDEIPVKSHAAIIPPDLVPKSPKPSSNHRELREPISSTPSPIIVKRQLCNSANRRNISGDVKNAADFPLTKTDSLAAFLQFEDELESSLAAKNHEKLSEKELKDKSNNLNKKSLSELIDNKTNDSNNEFGGGGGDRLPAIEIQTPQRLQSNPIKLAPIEKPLIKHKIMLEPLTANHSECNKNNNNNINNDDIRIDDNDNTIDSYLINSCDNLRLSNVSKLPNESSSFDQTNYCVTEATDASIENHLVTNATNFNCDSTRLSSSAESIDSHQNMELIVNLKNINDTADKRNPKRQMQLHKDNLLFDNAITIGSTDNQINQTKQLEEDIDVDDNNMKNASITSPSPKEPKTQSKFDDDCNKIGRKLSAKDVQNLETLFDDFDLEEFISTFSDNEQFPIFKNYKEMGTDQKRVSSRKQYGSESTSEESEFDEKFDTSDIDVSERERTASANSSIEHRGGGKCDSVGSSEANRKRESFERKVLKKPDVTAEAEKRMQIESELSKLGQRKHTTDTKLSQLQEILGETGEMSQAERELLASVQELNSMCDDSKTLDLTSDVFSPKTNDASASAEATFKSLFLQSPGEKSNNNGSIRFGQRNRHQPFNYQMPEIVGLASPNTSKDLGRFKTTPIEYLSSLKSDTTKLSTNGTKLNASLNGFDRVLPPIAVHKNDSQNIYNTINMTSSYHHDTRVDPLHQHKITSNDRIKLSSSSTTCRESNLSANQKLTKFCHECGARFIVDQAKFCMNCGVKRANLD
ncbi:uncharacterized protein LOC129576981 isoform X2 [Sitodiplosis mosellana]|uniref:uncharacterized protein LOC129576981 isoform X2 n=1 Tax=Sitodiplosis mosellana TaxID=263140 RepID=UPI0024440EFB|nr:uncharacterized protein LOC129576981 isoform X2 [Sitodiplosis mosellana]XP_055319253.1 uncharacterized protein LOC129576981 isoform X2 [Sitodiplosis mosellana]XP_055319254.1 uncharacterized protein LOC129576981 isoform X2 [Sitodiplosis mosellana]XP_055319255.1 uncharacterized protein LOC129576981 isoform X2 [Sitodiplosis mosellana]XP_055319256.1 uncharacterized protein LOC129576981 isoform X2 [Sitodiplosis mosellana]XP_055319257.1 uncharacterized protein LOC129576981 isoform X2 [Sitodiplosi